MIPAEAVAVSTSATVPVIPVTAAAPTATEVRASIAFRLAAVAGPPATVVAMALLKFSSTANSAAVPLAVAVTTPVVRAAMALIAATPAAPACASLMVTV